MQHLGNFSTICEEKRTVVYLFNHLRGLEWFLETCPHEREIVDSTAAVGLVGAAAAIASFVESTIFHNHGINVFSETTRHLEDLL